MTPQALIAQTLAPYPDLFERLNQTITPQRAFAFFKAIADTYAPTLTVRYTRAPVIEGLLGQAQEAGIGGANLNFSRNYRASGNVALALGSQPGKPVWAMAHLDMISFLTAPPSDGVYPLTPYCAARQVPGDRPALALAYTPETGTMAPVAHGHLHSDKTGHTFVTEVTNLPPATRVVYAAEAIWDQASGMLYGTVDNAFGCAALLLAALVLSHYPVEALMVFTDEEEGVVAAGPPAFSRGALRLLNRLTPAEMPDLITITDHHEEVAALSQGIFDDSRFGHGALFAGFASHAKGGVTPPQLLAFQRALAHYLADQGISLQENPGYASRSDCVSAVLATPNIALIGYPCAYSHFIDTPRAHLDDLIHLAKSLAVYLLIAQDKTWRAQYL